MEYTELDTYAYIIYYAYALNKGYDRIHIDSFIDPDERFRFCSFYSEAKQKLRKIKLEKLNDY